MENQKPLLGMIRDSQSEKAWEDNRRRKPISQPPTPPHTDIVVVNCRFVVFLPSAEIKPQSPHSPYPPTALLKCTARFTFSALLELLPEL